MGEICSRDDTEDYLATCPRNYPSIILTSDGSVSDRQLSTARFERSTVLVKSPQKSFLRLRNAVLMAAHRRQYERIERFILEGFPVDYPLTQSGWRLVHVAAHTGDEKLLKLLIGLGADLSIKDDEEGMTALAVAILRQKAGVLRLLCPASSDAS